MVVFRIEKTSGQATTQAIEDTTAPPGSFSIIGTWASRLKPRQTSLPARPISNAILSTKASCAERAALFWPSDSASWAIPAAVNRSVSWPLPDTMRSSKPEARSSISNTSCDGHPAERYTSRSRRWWCRVKGTETMQEAGILYSIVEKILM